jgi:hypothetical protein
MIVRRVNDIGKEAIDEEEIKWSLGLRSFNRDRARDDTITASRSYFHHFASKVKYA